MAITGIDSIFYIKYNDEFVPIACEVSSPLSETVEMTDTTTRDNEGWKTEKPTLQSYSIQIEATLRKDFEDAGLLSYNKLRTMKRNKELIEWQKKVLDGYYIDTGFAYISAISDSNVVGEEITFSLTLNGFGKPLEDTDIQFILGENDEIVIADIDNNLIETK